MKNIKELNENQIDNLQAIAGLMIPANDAHSVPAADDPDVMFQIIKLAAQRIEKVSDALDRYENTHTSDISQKTSYFRKKYPAEARILEELIVHCYYQDDRVMKSLGMEARAPFPIGFDVEQGNWALLDPVRAMEPIYKKLS